ncbi:MAG: DUF2779 domain-containing protein [Planctomycetes bacterium]|nr:DUF2779 domain-containing protein [Planctomycetota bacterium]MCB9886781.1 DUF2779 domain-containing protein [Planctomycetota bacterium]
MKKTSSKQPPRLDKHLYESGLQCQKRLWLDFHEPAEETPGSTRTNLAAVGTQLREIARSAFPKGVVVGGKSLAARAEQTKELLDGGEPVLFGATFVTDEAVAEVDILVQHKDGQIDVFEIKSGTKIKQRYLADLALQVHAARTCGLEVRAVFLLHVQPRYEHRADADFPPMQLMRSADVTKQVEKQVEQVQRRLTQLRGVLAEADAPDQPMGSYCTAPFRCPHFAQCSEQAPDLPLFELPDLNRALESQLRREGVRTLRDLDPQHEGLSFKQRRTIAAVQQGTPMVEPFVKEELRDCRHPLHFVAIAALTEPLPRFGGQRPWRHVPFGWAANTVHEDGRVETVSFCHNDKSDPRPAFITSLAKQLECGGTVVCWNDRSLDDLRELLEDLPDQKAAIRAVIGRAHLDMMHLLDAGAFHPDLRGHRDLAKTVAAFLPGFRGSDTTALDEDALRAAIEKICAPRARVATRDKLAAEIEGSLKWASEALLALYRHFGEVEIKSVAKPAAPAVADKKSLPKKLPKPLPG